MHGWGFTCGGGGGGGVGTFSPPPLFSRQKKKKLFGFVVSKQRGGREKRPPPPPPPPTSETPTVHVCYKRGYTHNYSFLGIVGITWTDTHLVVNGAGITVFWYFGYILLAIMKWTEIGGSCDSRMVHYKIECTESSSSVGSSTLYSIDQFDP